jgi:hypothetical protein
LETESIMKVVNSKYAAAVAMAALLVAGCSNGGSQFAPLGGTRALSPLSHEVASTMMKSSTANPAECASPNPAQVGQCHLAIMQTIVEHFAQIKAATPQAALPSGVAFLQTALQVPQIDSQDKAIISQTLTTYESMQGLQISETCQEAENQFDAGIQSAIASRPTFSKILAYLKEELNKYPSCAGFSFGVESAMFIIRDGESTIYNAKWYASLGVKPGTLRQALPGVVQSDKTTWGSTLIDAGGADIEGGVGGAIVGALSTGGPGAGPAALIGAGGASVGSLCHSAWNWFWGK